MKNTQSALVALFAAFIVVSGIHKNSVQHQIMKSKKRVMLLNTESMESDYDESQSSEYMKNYLEKVTNRAQNESTSITEQINKNLTSKDIFNPEETYWNLPYSDTNKTVDLNAATAIFSIDVESTEIQDAADATLFQLVQILNFIVYGKDIESINDELSKLRLFTQNFWEDAEEAGEQSALIGSDISAEVYFQLIIMDLDELAYLTPANKEWLDDFKKGMDVYFDT